jgi:hypothetical protein
LTKFFANTRRARRKGSIADVVSVKSFAVKHLESRFYLRKPLRGDCHGQGAMIRSTILVLALFSAAQAWSWGDTGHRIICEIAFQELTDTARAEAIRLIRLDDAFTRFYDSCTWPDHPRQRSTEHYANYPRTTRKITTEHCLTADECIFTAIATDLAVLKDNAATDEARLASLKFLGHWVGDLHQPLHVSFQDDRIIGNQHRVDELTERDRLLRRIAPRKVLSFHHPSDGVL